MSTLLLLSAWALAGVYAYKKKLPTLKLNDSASPPAFSNAQVQLESGSATTGGCVCNISTLSPFNGNFRYANASDGPDSMAETYGITVPGYYYEVCDCTNGQNYLTETGTCSTFNGEFVTPMITQLNPNADQFVAYCPMSQGISPTP